MTANQKGLAILLFSLVAACAPDETLQGHQLRLSAIDQPGVSWITQDDVRRAERIQGPSGQPLLRLHLRPDAAQRMLALTDTHIGKKVQVSWDGNVTSELKVQTSFGSPFELPAPPR